MIKCLLIYMIYLYWFKIDGEQSVGISTDESLDVWYTTKFTVTDRFDRSQLPTNMQFNFTHERAKSVKSFLSLCDFVCESTPSLRRMISEYTCEETLCLMSLNHVIDTTDWLSVENGAALQMELLNTLTLLNIEINRSTLMRDSGSFSDGTDDVVNGFNKTGSNSGELSHSIQNDHEPIHSKSNNMIANTLSPSLKGRFITLIVPVTSREYHHLYDSSLLSSSSSSAGLDEMLKQLNGLPLLQYLIPSLNNTVTSIADALKLNLYMGYDEDDPIYDKPVCLQYIVKEIQLQLPFIIIRTVRLSKHYSGKIVHIWNYITSISARDHQQYQQQKVRKQQQQQNEGGTEESNNVYIDDSDNNNNKIDSDDTAIQIYCLLNDDLTFLTSNWIQPMIHTLSHHNYNHDFNSVSVSSSSSNNNNSISFTSITDYLPYIGMVSFYDLQQQHSVHKWFPSFPVFSSIHLDIFGKETAFDPVFIHAMADPWIYDIYSIFRNDVNNDNNNSSKKSNGDSCDVNNKDTCYVINEDNDVSNLNSNTRTSSLSTVLWSCEVYNQIGGVLQLQAGNTPLGRPARYDNVAFLKYKKVGLENYIDKVQYARRKIAKYISKQLYEKYGILYKWNLSQLAYGKEGIYYNEYCMIDASPGCSY